MRPTASLFLFAALATLLSACGETGPSPPDSVPPLDSGAQQDNLPESFASDDLPPRFNDYVPKVVREYDNPRGYIYHPAESEPFEMVLVPGDVEAGIEPFYIGRTEVTWDMFEQWANRTDIEWEEAEALMDRDLRPSVWPDFAESIVMGLGQRPATGMSWRTAEAFCLWLSEQTGRTYRLPTDAEWSHVLALSGGLPADEAALLARAALAENSLAVIDDGWWETEVTRYVAGGQPDALGLYDLLGNVAEWVQPTDEGRWVRGGHFGLPAVELTADWRAVEDQMVWNETYPQHPVSRYWYRDHYYQGLRLVCEADNLPKEVGEPLIYPRRYTGEVPYRDLTDEAEHRHNDALRPEPSGIESGLGWPRPTFDMTLIPGDKASGIAPFYMQTTEVTWDMFGNWFAGRGLGDAAFERWRGYGFHPSMYWESDMVKMGLGDRPAVGMSRRAAELFCEWLSEETGRAYRLPTDAEWRHALAAGGGMPANWDDLLEQAALHNKVGSRAAGPRSCA